MTKYITGQVFVVFWNMASCKSCEYVATQISEERSDLVLFGGRT